MSSHEHYAGEFGSTKKLKKTIEKDSAYHRLHAKKHAQIAAAAKDKILHSSLTHGEVAEQKMIIAHALKKTEKHAAEAAKLAPGSSHAEDTKASHAQAKNAMEDVQKSSATSSAVKSGDVNSSPSVTKKIATPFTSASQSSTGHAAQLTSSPKKSSDKNDAAYHLKHAAKHEAVAKAAMATFQSPSASAYDKSKAKLIVANALKKVAKHKSALVSMSAESNAITSAYGHHSMVHVIYNQMNKSDHTTHKSESPLKSSGSSKTSSSSSTNEDYSFTTSSGKSGRTLDVEEFHSMRKSFTKALTLEQRESALTYSGSSYMSINASLRSGLQSEYAQGHIKNLDAMFSHSHAVMKDNVKVFRGAGGDGAYTHYSTMKDGDTYVEKGYSSTSMEHGSAFGGCVVMHITVPKGGRAAPIPSEHPNEKEMLLPRDQKFHIDKIEHVSPKNKYDKPRIIMHVTAIQE